MSRVSKSLGLFSSNRSIFCFKEAPLNGLLDSFRMAVFHQKAVIRSLGLGKVKGMKINLIINHDYMMKINIPKLQCLEHFWVSEHVQVLTGWHTPSFLGALTPVLRTLLDVTLCTSFILFFNYILYHILNNKFVKTSKCFLKYCQSLQQIIKSEEEVVGVLIYSQLEYR